MFDFLLNAFATLFVTIDPIGLAPMVLVLTAGVSRPNRIKIVLRGTLTGAGILLVFFFFGQVLLSSLGISIEAFRVAGGLLLLIIAIEMVFNKRQQRKTETAEKVVHDHAPDDDMQDLAVFPIAIPLVAGPAAISAVILLSSRAPDALSYIGLGIVLLFVVALCLVAFMVADRLERFFGNTAQLIVTRLLGVLLAALSVQFIADGVRAFVLAG